MAYYPVEVYNPFDHPVTHTAPLQIAANNSVYSYNGAHGSRNAVFLYNDILYNFVIDYYGDHNPAEYLDPDYFDSRYRCCKSLDEGETWTEVDETNSIYTGASFTGGYGEAYINIGTKVWVLYDYNEHIDLDTSFPAVDYTGQFARINVGWFDLNSETWCGTNTITSGPLYAPTWAGTAYAPRDLTLHAVARGNEIIVLHRDVTGTSTVANPVCYSIFDTTSLTWVGTNTQVFPASGDEYSADCNYDGTYVHFANTPAVHTWLAGTYTCPHRTLNSGNSLGAYTDLLANFPIGAWPTNLASAKPYAFSGSFPVTSVVHNGEIIYAFMYQGYDKWGTEFFDTHIGIARSPTGVATPTWTCGEIDSDAWNAAMDTQSQAGMPCFTVTGTNLYCCWGNQLPGFVGYNPALYDWRYYGKRYLGSGTWDTEEFFWGYRDTYPSFTSGVGSFPNTIYAYPHIFGIGNLAGNSTVDRIDTIGLGILYYGSLPYETGLRPTPNYGLCIVPSWIRTFVADTCCDCHIAF